MRARKKQGTLHDFCQKFREILSSIPQQEIVKFKYKSIILEAYIPIVFKMLIIGFSKMM